MKRSFPYASAVPEVELKRRDLGARAGTEAAQPRIYSSSLPMQYEQTVRLRVQQGFAHDSCLELRGHAVRLFYSTSLVKGILSNRQQRQLLEHGQKLS